MIRLKKYSVVKVRKVVVMAMLISSGTLLISSCGNEKNASEQNTKNYEYIEEEEDTLISDENIEEAYTDDSEINSEEGESAGTDEAVEDASDEGINEAAISQKTEKREAIETDSEEGWVRVRKEPTTNSKELFKVQSAKKFYVTKIEGSQWCKFYLTEDGKQVGYIHSKYVKPVGVKIATPKESKPTGKYHVIIGSFDNAKNAQAKYEKLKKWADAEILFEKESKKYRVSIYSSADKSNAEKVKADVAKDGYPKAWILKF